ncbi:glycoside hydrolase family 65 protein [Lawsonella clevelandensis]|uniref:glycoside hydrolase family 65 protein n=1 Tax=Lawsonella clevelandensis TaxID=1528099 RepID=UPI0023F1547C|nr:glycosyl hydrolase family 65 protein [Lawsonella clevelandensis]
MTERNSITDTALHTTETITLSPDATPDTAPMAEGQELYDEQVTASGPHRDRFNLRSYFAEPEIDRSIHPVDPWRWVETAPSTSDLGVAESLFTVGNGYLGVRGNPEEGRDSALNGTYVNGLHETWDIQHAEDAYGLARVGQSIINAPDAKTIRIYVDDEPLRVSVADLFYYERSLDFRDGVLRRSLEWRTPAGKRVLIDFTRMVSLTDRHLGIEEVSIVLPEDAAPVVLSSQILNRQDGQDEFGSASDPDRFVATEGAPQGSVNTGSDPRRADHFRSRVLLPLLQVDEGEKIKLGYRVANSGMTLAVGADHDFSTTNDFYISSVAQTDMAKVQYHVDARPGQKIVLTKYFSYHDSRRASVNELMDRVDRTLRRARKRGAGDYLEAQQAWLAEFWERADVEIPDQPELQQAVRWNMFQLIQSSARAEDLGISAKGVTGSGSAGHYFWDTEIYVMPFLTYTMPQVARNALRFRYQMLPKARDRASELDQCGALYPWRTINGEEASAYYAAGTAQYHIDADITYATVQYARASGDADFLFREAIDILVETARLWEDLGFFGVDGQFHIHGVTGPDEYTTVVNDNLFTNVMARYNMRVAAEWVERLREVEKSYFEEMVHRLNLRPEEPAEWRTAADAMCIPFDGERGIHPQDAHFLEREIWNKDRGQPKRPLLLHYHPLTIYRYQVIKQADVVLALFLRGSEFSEKLKRADFDYYDPLTTGDSSLSAVVQCILAAELGYDSHAQALFRHAVYVDLCNLHGNSADGLHIASCGGVWSALVFGFGGLRDYDGRWTINPVLPEGWGSMRYRVQLWGSRLQVEVRADEVELEWDSPVAVGLEVWGQSVTVQEGEKLVVKRPQ